MNGGILEYLRYLGRKVPCLVKKKNNVIVADFHRHPE